MFEKYNEKKRHYYTVEWYSVDGRYVRDIFTGMGADWPYGTFDVSYVHRWKDPYEGLRKYLQHLPLHNVKITAHEV